jgi:hypothetical protein
MRSKSKAAVREANNCHVVAKWWMSGAKRPVSQHALMAYTRITLLLFMPTAYHTRAQFPIIQSTRYRSLDEELQKMEKFPSATELLLLLVFIT